MCLYPKLIKNPKYRPNKKNKGIIPECKDQRLLYVAVGCGFCIECRKQKARAWQIRLYEEIKTQNKKIFITLTFNNESFEKLEKIKKTNDANEIAAIAIRRFLERYRKKYKKSMKHWLIVELGETNTERMHLHGIIFPNENCTQEELQEIWKYGIIDFGNYVNKKTINYIMKYVTKIDKIHPKFIPKIFCSAGIGKNYTKEEFNINTHKYRPKKTKEYYTTQEGYKINLPIYYRNKFYTEEEREKLWLEKIEEQKIYVNGIEIDISTEKGYQNYLNVLKKQQEENLKLGYGNDTWKVEKYTTKLRQLNQKKKYNELNNNI